MWQIPVGIGVGVLYSGQSPQRAATATGLTLAGAAIVRAFGWRTAGSAAWFAVRAVGAMTLQGFTGAVIGGAIVGTGVSYALFGKEGAKDALDLYTGQVSPTEYVETLAKAPGRIAESIELNRAVEGNVAGLPTGWQVDVHPAFEDQNQWKLDNFRKTFPNA